VTEDFDVHIFYLLS